MLTQWIRDDCSAGWCVQEPDFLLPSPPHLSCLFLSCNVLRYPIPSFFPQDQHKHQDTPFASYLVVLRSLKFRFLLDTYYDMRQLHIGNYKIYIFRELYKFVLEHAKQNKSERFLENCFTSFPLPPPLPSTKVSRYFSEFRETINVVNVAIIIMNYDYDYYYCYYYKYYIIIIKFIVYI